MRALLIVLFLVLVVLGAAAPRKPMAPMAPMAQSSSTCLAPIIQVWGCFDSGFSVQTTTAAAPYLRQCLSPSSPAVLIGNNGWPDNNCPLSPACQYALLQLNYTTGVPPLPFHQPGVIVGTPVDTGVERDPARLRWIQQAQATGRVLGTNAFEFAWDWLMAPEHTLTQTGVVDELTTLVESASAANCGLPAVLMGDSCGAALVTGFLAQKTRAWKAKYAARNVVQGDDHGGEFDVSGLLSPAAAGSIYFNDSAVDAQAIQNFEGLWRILPNRQLYWDTPMVYIQSTHTTVTVGEFPAFMVSNGFAQAAAHWLNNQYGNPFPNANITCVWASGARTPRVGQFATEQASTFLSSYEYSYAGDGEQPPTTDSWCREWAVPAALAGLQLGIESFPNVTVPADIPDAHTALPSDPTFWKYLLYWISA